MPILGGIASGISGNLYNASYESISTVTVGAGGSSTITFSSIPQTYLHLQVRIFNVSAATYSDMNFNSDFNNNYSYAQLYADGSTVTSAASGSMNTIYSVQTGGTTTYPSMGIMDIYDYSSTTKNKTVRLQSGLTANGTGLMYFRSGVWFNTAAITTIRFTAQAGSGTFAQNTVYALYGLKGA